MTTMKNILMVLVALCLVLSFAPVSAADVENLTDAEVIAEVITPTPIPTLESMTHARVMSDGSMYPNYKVKEFNLKDEIPDYSKFGYAVFYVRAGGSAQDLNVWIIKDGENVTAFDATYHPDKTEIEGQNKDYTLVKVLPDGQSDLTKLDAGDWTAYIQNGNGGQTETKKFKVGNGDITRVAFLGHAVSSDVTTCVPVYTIINATYGLGHTSCHMETVTDIEAYNEHGNGWHKQTSDCTETYTVYGQWSKNKPHHCEYETRIVPAQTHEVEVCVVDGEVIPVTIEVQSAVSRGATSFLFDNRPTVGGIFSIDGNLLSQIKDPAPGYVKNVYIKYSNGCGSTNTIEAMEYDHINLATGSVTPEATS
jgi:hypothetical protein